MLIKKRPSYTAQVPFSAQGFLALQHEVDRLQLAAEHSASQLNHHIRVEKKSGKENLRLKEQIQTLTTDLLKALQENRKSQNKIGRQQKEIAELHEALRIAKLSLNSANSSRPPSTDLYKPKRNSNYSLRRRSGKRTGGQKGHAGSTLPFNTSVADFTVEYTADYCSECGKDLSMIHGAQHQVRQMVDIPVPKPILTNHITLSKVCACGYCNTGEFPDNVSSRVGYGSGVEALVVNLSARQYIPFRRLTEFLSDVFRISISEGTVANLLERFEGKAETVHKHIQQQILKAEVVGSDETGAKVNGSNGWFHAYQTPLWTFIGYHASRGKEARELFFPTGLPKTILVSDCLAMQLSTPAAAHQACMAHLLRELNAMQEAHPNQIWPTKLKTLFQQALQLNNGLLYPVEVEAIENEFKNLLTLDQSAAPGKIPAFWKRMQKHAEKIFTFLHNDNVPADNNGSERAIRNVKVKQKVSGQFKTHKGAMQYAMNRSIIDTLNKQGKNVHEALLEIANFTPD